ncbi:hypothetical protein ACWGOQ_0012645 [Aquimarina sp. M1]
MKITRILLITILLSILFIRCSNENEDVNSHEVYELDFLSHESSKLLPVPINYKCKKRKKGLPLNWMLVDGGGTITDNGRNIKGQNDRGGTWLNEDIKKIRNRCSTSFSFDYDYSNTLATVIIEFAEPSADQVQISRQNFNNSVFIIVRDENKDIAFIRNIPFKGRVTITPEEIYINYRLLEVPSFEFSFEHLKMGVSANNTISNMNLTGFGIDKGIFSPPNRSHQVSQSYSNLDIKWHEEYFDNTNNVTIQIWVNDLIVINENIINDGIYNYRGIEFGNMKVKITGGSETDEIEFDYYIEGPYL